MRIVRTIRNLLLALLVLLLIGWLTGPVGSGIRHWVSGRMPYQAGKEFCLDAVYVAETFSKQDERIYFTIGLDRVQKALREASVLSYLLPQGLLKEGLVIEGTWIPWKRDRETRIKALMGVEIPVGIVIADTPGGHPHLTGNISAPLLTQYLAKEFERDFKEEREEWELGHYAYEIHPEVMTCRLQTTNEVGLLPERYAERLYLTLEAYAKVDMTFEENIGSFDADGDLAVRILGELYFEPMADGLSPRYRADFQRVDANIKGMNNLIDDKLSDKLKKKWQKSLNKEKRRKRLAEKRLPAWFPTDLVINLKFHSD